MTSTTHLSSVDCLVKASVDDALYSVVQHHGASLVCYGLASFRMEWVWPAIRGRIAESAEDPALYASSDFRVAVSEAIPLAIRDRARGGYLVYDRPSDPGPFAKPSSFTITSEGLAALQAASEDPEAPLPSCVTNTRATLVSPALRSAAEVPSPLELRSLTGERLLRGLEVSPEALRSPGTLYLFNPQESADGLSGIVLAIRRGGGVRAERVTEQVGELVLLISSPPNSTEHLSQEEISQALGIAPANVKSVVSKLNRALKALKVPTLIAVRGPTRYPLAALPPLERLSLR
jgi:hypothetical protein